jgi:hypothetical protein
VSDISDTLRIMAANIDATRPECDYSASRRGVDDADIEALRRAANTIDGYRESFANMARERDGLWEDLERVTKERDEARRDACELWADAQFDGTDAVPSEYAKRRGWQCFPHTDGASSPEIPDNSRQALDRLARLDEEAGL